MMHLANPCKFLPISSPSSGPLFQAPYPQILVQGATQTALSSSQISSATWTAFVRNTHSRPVPRACSTPLGDAHATISLSSTLVALPPTSPSLEQAICDPFIQNLESSAERDEAARALVEVGGMWLGAAEVDPRESRMGRISSNGAWWA